jgi:hypothetical protein
LSLLGEAGSTAIDPKEDAELLKRWERSDLWPVTAEQSTSVFGAAQEPAHIFAKFCPEVSFDRWGWFATTLARYADETDKDSAHSALARQGANGSDWRWAWSQVGAMHYSDCPLYSPLVGEKARTADQSSGEIIGIKPGIWGMSIDLRALWRRISRWWARFK